MRYRDSVKSVSNVPLVSSLSGPRGVSDWPLPECDTPACEEIVGLRTLQLYFKKESNTAASLI